MIDTYMKPSKVIGATLNVSGGLFVASVKKKQTTPARVCYNALIETSPLGKAQLFNNFFYTNFSTGSNMDIPEINSDANPNLMNIQFDIIDIRLLLTSVD